MLGKLRTQFFYVITQLGQLCGHSGDVLLRGGVCLLRTARLLFNGFQLRIDLPDGVAQLFALKVCLCGAPACFLHSLLGAVQALLFARYGDILLVNSENRLDANYEPPELMNLYEMRHSFRLASSNIYLTRECYTAMERMFAAAEDADMNGYIVTSGYRNYKRQAEIYAESEPGYAQEPGASEHQTGLSFDVTVETNKGFENTPQYSWLMKNAHEYGFIQRYPANKVEKTGISYEPWHYRYVGVKAAKKMNKSGLCLEEFLAASAK
jgi:LAS superfamily LD-carboxypeptidase LdcB